MPITYRPAKFLKRGDTIAFFTDPVGGYEIKSVEQGWDRGWNWEIRIPVVTCNLGRNGYVEYHAAAPVPVLT